MAAFLKNIQNTSFRYELWAKGTKILVAVSGGPDSVCLLDVLATLAPKYSWQLRVVHMNYGLRGKDAEDDEQLVRAWAQRYDVPLSVAHPRVETLKRNLEERLRTLRYRFFERIRQQYAFDVVAVAHTEDDQAETVLLRLLRGSGLQGMGAMQPRNGTIIRPLLFTSRAEIQKYLKEKHLTFRLDKTNLDIQYLRNRVRHKLIPYLEKHFNPNVTETLSRAATQWAEDYVALEQLGKDQSFSYQKKNQGIIFSREDFLSQDSVWQKHFLRLFARQLGHQTGLLSAHTDELRRALKSSQKKPCSLTVGGLKLIHKGDTVRITLS